MVIITAAMMEMNAIITVTRGYEEVGRRGEDVQATDMYETLCSVLGRVKIRHTIMPTMPNAIVQAP